MSRHPHVWISLGLGIILVVGDCAVDAFFFGDGGFLDELLRPAPIEIWTRSLIVGACVALNAVNQFLG